MTSPSEPGAPPVAPTPLLFVVPARRAVVRDKITYEGVMNLWFSALRDLRPKLIEWYEPLRAPGVREAFGSQLDRAINFVEERWLDTMGCATGREGVLCQGSNRTDDIVPRVRLWKGPMRVLLEQKAYGVLGRTLRRGSSGALTPEWSPPMMPAYDVGGSSRVETDGVVKINVKGTIEELVQEESGEVSGITNFLPGDLIEFPIFLVLAKIPLPGFERARFNALGSPFLGTSVEVVPAPLARAGTPTPGLRIHDNLIAMRFQLLFNLARGSFSSLRKTFNGAEPGAQTLSEIPSENELLDEEHTEEELDALHLREMLALRQGDGGAEAIETSSVPLTEAQIDQRARRRRELDRLAAAANRALVAWRDARDLHQEHGHASRYRTAYNKWYAAMSRYMTLLDTDADRRERRYVRRRRAAAMVNYNSKAAHADFESGFGVTLFAHGILYGGSLTSTAPVRYGTPSRFFNNNWGHSRSPTKLTIGGRGFRAIIPLRPAGNTRSPDSEFGDCDRLTLAWSCTPSTLATSYFLLHSLRIRAGGSVRSQFDASCSIYCEVDANGVQIAGAALRSRFFTFWPPLLREDGTIDPNEPGLPADVQATSEFIGTSQRDARQYLDSRSPYFEGREDASGNPIEPPFAHPGVRCPPNVPPALWRAWKERDAGGDGPEVFAVGIEQLRKYFLEQKQAQFTVVSLSGHEYMHVWLMPHALLAQEAAVTDAGQQPWSTLYRPQSAATVDPQSASRTLYRTNDTDSASDTHAVAPSAEPPRASDSRTNPTQTSEHLGDEPQLSDPLPTTMPVPGEPEPPTPLSVEGQLRRMTRAERRRAVAAARNARTHANQIEVPPEDYSPEHSVGQDLESETLWRAANAQVSAWQGPQVGPPVAGFIAAYDPLTGVEYDTTELGDFFTFEAAGSRVPVTLPAALGRSALSTVVMSGGPFRWESLTSIVVLLGEQHPLFGQVLHVSRDRSASAPSEEDQKLQAFTHFRVDAMRALHKNPIALEPIHLFSPGQARTHAFTRADLDPLPSNSETAEAERRSTSRRFDESWAAVKEADRSLQDARTNGGDVAAALRSFDAAYAEFEAAQLASRGLPLQHPEWTSEHVAAVWYSDRAVPFPTFFEARDDEQYFRKGKVAEQRDPIAQHLTQFQDSPSAVAQLSPPMRKLLRSGVRLME